MEFRLLGTLAVQEGAVALKLGSPKQAALLAILCLNANEVVPVDRLAEDLWGGRPPPSAASTLQGYVSALRRILEPGVPADAHRLLVTRRPGYLLQIRPEQLDVSRFESLVATGRAELATHSWDRASSVLGEALGLWRGRALADFVYEPFAQAEAARLEAMRLAVAEDRVRAELALGHHAEVVDELRHLVAVTPLHEQLQALLMLALYRCGRQAEALRACADLRRRLSEELGIDPSPEVARLEEAILLQKPELDWGDDRGDRRTAAAAEMVGTIQEAPSDGTGGPTPLPLALEAALGQVFVGRQAERSVIEAAGRRAAAGRRQAVLVGGEPGIGKSRLVAEAAMAAAVSGGLVLHGRCDEELGVAYQPFVEALRPYVATCSVAALAEHTAIHGGELCRLLPELSRRLPDVPQPVAAEPDVERLRLFEAVEALLTAASHRAPVVLVLDDLQWATRPTLLLTRHLLRSAWSASLLVLGTYRSCEVSATHPLTQVLADLRREPGIEWVALTGLDEDAVGRLVLESGPSTDENGSLTRSVHARTAGNPFFVGELLRHLAESGDRDSPGSGVPDGVRDVVGRRLLRLSEAANRVLRLAAVFGRTFSTGLLASAAGEDPDVIIDAVEEAVGARLVAELARGSELHSFAHDLVRETLYDDLGAARRARLHRRVGEAMEAIHATHGAHVAALAHHFSLAAATGTASKAAEYALLAAERATAQAAYEEAVTHLERGLAALEAGGVAAPERRCELLLALAPARLQTLDLVGMRTAAHEAAVTAQRMGSVERLARAACAHTPIASVGKLDQDGVDLCLLALGALGAEERVLRAQVLATLAIHQAYAGHHREALAASEEALALARSAGEPGALGSALEAGCIARWGSEHAGEGLVLAEELLARGPASPGSLGWVNPHRLRALPRLTLGDVAGFDADVAEVQRLGTELGNRDLLLMSATWRTLRALLDGRFDEVETLAASHRAIEGEDVSAAFTVQMFQLRFEQGRLSEMKPALLAAAARYPLGNTAVRAALALSQVELGELEEARRGFEALAAGRFACVPRAMTWPVSLAYLTEVSVALGDADRAVSLFELMRPHRGHLVVGGGVVCPGAVDRYLGMLATELGRLDDAVGFFEAAAGLEAQISAAPALARTLACFAAALLMRDLPGDRVQAVQLLHASLDRAQALAMAGVVQRATALLDAAECQPSTRMD